MRMIMISWMAASPKLNRNKLILAQLTTWTDTWVLTPSHSEQWSKGDTFYNIPYFSYSHLRIQICSRCIQITDQVESMENKSSVVESLAVHPGLLGGLSEIWVFVRKRRPVQVARCRRCFDLRSRGERNTIYFSMVNSNNKDHCSVNHAENSLIFHQGTLTISISILVVFILWIGSRERGKDGVLWKTDQFE